MSYPCWLTSLKTAPAAEPVSRTEAKAHLRVTVTDDDTLIDSLIVTAREWVEAYTNRALISQTWYWKADRFPCDGPIWLPRPPLVSITSVSYVDTNGQTQTWAATTGYELSQPAGPKAAYARLQPAYGTQYPTTRDQMEAVTIEYVCGYGASSTNVPGAIRSAMLLLIGHLYENREGSVVGVSASEIPMGVAALLAPYQVYSW